MAYARRGLGAVVSGHAARRVGLESVGLPDDGVDRGVPYDAALVALLTAADHIDSLGNHAVIPVARAVPHA